MAAGVVFASGKLYPVASNSCYDVATALSFNRTTNMTGYTCSAFEIVNGSTVTLSYSSNPTSVAYSVLTIDATPHGTADLGSKATHWVETSFLLQALLIVAAVFILFKCYSSRDKKRFKTT